MGATDQLVGVDVGGTFTDFLWLIDGRMEVRKVATTPDDQSRAIQVGLDELGVSESAALAHGTTTATNALLERRGARCALLTTRGFRDVLAIGRQNRPDLYRLTQQRPPAVVPDELRFEVPERLSPEGDVIVSLDENAVERLAADLSDVDSVAIVFLFSFKNDAHERRTAKILREKLPDVHLSLSVDVLPEYREYERTAATAVNAYVQPLVARYLNNLRKVVAPRRVRIMQSNGGTIGTEQAAEQPARLVLSGPAGGVVGALSVAKQALGTEGPRIITLDMGGTSTDVALCPGYVPRTSESEIAGLPLRLPSVDIHTVGAGGGSIARVDAAGALHVGPESAGAEPGPACYGRGGTTPTVTDAHLVLGRLRADRFLGGERTLDVDAARSAVGALADRLGMSTEEAAEGMIRVANATMERALRRVSVERGHDPKEYVLVPFGGAGPLHACELAEALSIRKILLPPSPGVLSALGLLAADVVYERSVSALNRDVLALYDAEEAAVREVMAGEGHDAPDLEAVLDVRYAGQSYELQVPVDVPPDDDALLAAVERFHGIHRRRYGHDMPGEATEVVTLRVRGIAAAAGIDLPREQPASSDVTETRIPGGAGVPAYDRTLLKTGHAFGGPALVYQYDTTIFITDGWDARVDAYSNLLLHR